MSDDIELFDAVVRGPKSFSALERNEDGTPTGNHYHAQPGETIRVTAMQLERFPQRLILPEVQEAVAAADKAVKKANKAVAKANAKRKPRGKPTKPDKADKADKPAKAATEKEKTPAQKAAATRKRNAAARKKAAAGNAVADTS